MKSTYDSFMSFFEKGTLGKKRKELISSAYGNVLEIGSGTGVNLAFYDVKNINHIVLTDETINSVLMDKLNQVAFNYDVQKMDVEKLLFEDKCFDTIVVTLVFCSVKNVEKGLSELRRVLKDKGQLIFIEHVLPDHEPLAGLFNAVTPVWKRMASNCHLNRDFLDSLDEALFNTTDISKFNKSAFVSGKAYKKAKSI